MAYAKATDVQAIYGKSLTPDETVPVNRRLEQVERRILHRIPDLADQIAAGDIDQDDVVDIEAEDVLRVIRNPEGLFSEQDGSYGYQLSREAADNSLRITAEEWDPSGSSRARCSRLSRTSEAADEPPAQRNRSVHRLARGTDIDSSGNRMTKPGTVGVVCRAVVQPLSSTENGEGTTSTYRLRLVGYDSLLGAQSAVEWNGKRYAIDGDPKIYNGSRRTAHVEYTLIRR